MQYLEIIPGVLKFNSIVYQDNRGYNICNFNRFQEGIKKLGIEYFNVDNFLMSYSVKNTVRGLHFQEFPLKQSKLIQCSAGKIYDVFLNINKDSQNYGLCGGTLLDKNNFLFLTNNYAHGFFVLSNFAIINYLMDNLQSNQHQRVVNIYDNSLTYDKPINIQLAIMSDRDRYAKSWVEL